MDFPSVRELQGVTTYVGCRYHSIAQIQIFDMLLMGASLCVCHRRVLLRKCHTVERFRHFKSMIQRGHLT